MQQALIKLTCLDIEAIKINPFYIFLPQQNKLLNLSLDLITLSLFKTKTGVEFELTTSRARTISAEIYNI